MRHTWRALYVLLYLIPFLALLYESQREVFVWRELLALALPTGRTGGLFVATLLYAGGAALLATLIGVAVALRLHLGSPRMARLALTLGVAWIALPPYVHALAWLRLLTRWCGVSGTGWWVAGWVQAQALWPIPFILTLVALRRIDPALVDAARLAQGAGEVIRRVILPLAAPGIGAGGLVVFCLSLTEYTIPALFQVTAYAMEIQAEFSASHEACRAFSIALPLILVAGLLLVPLAGSLRRLIQRAPGRPGSFALSLEGAGVWRCGLTLASGLALFSFLLLVAALGQEVIAVRALPQRLGATLADLETSLFVALGAGLFALPFAVVGAWSIRTGGAGLGLLLAPLAIPSSLLGLAVASGWNRLAPEALITTPVGLALGLGLRALPIATLACLAQLLQVEAAVLDAGALYQRSECHGWWRFRLPLAVPGMIAAAGFSMAIALGEVGLALPLAPPGHSTLAIRIFNYLHYGASSEVAMLCLLQTVLVLLVAGIAAWELGARKERHA